MATDEEAARLLALFEGNEQYHGVHGEPDWDDAKQKWAIRSTARTYQGPATIALWRAHLNGTTPLGVVPIMQGDRCCWGSIDVDDYTIDKIALIKKVEVGKYPLVGVRSKSNGLHLFIFFEYPELAAEVQALLRDLRAALGLADCEIFPKQSRLVDERDKGSWIVMPYFGGTYDGKLKNQHGIRSSGSEMELDEFLDAAEAARTTLKAVKIRRAPKPRVNGHAADNTTAAFGNGPPCLEHMAPMGVTENRDDVAFMMGVYAKVAHPDDWRAKLEEYNNLYISPPGSPEWVVEKIKSLEKKDYAYTCGGGTRGPTLKFCNPVLCRARKYGIVKDGAAIPRITEIRKYDAEPPLFTVETDGGCRVRLTVDQLLDYRKFIAMTLSKSNSKLVYGPMKDADWKALLGIAMQDCEIDPPTPDSGDLADFMAHLHTYMFQRAISQTVNDLVATGKPFEDKDGEIEGEEYRGFYYVSLPHLASYMRKEGLTIDDGGRSRAIYPNIIGARLRDELGAVHVPKNFKNGTRQLWRIPPGALQGRPPSDEPPLLPPPRESKI